MMLIEVVTLFPEMVDVVLKTSILERAEKFSKVEYRVHNLRKWAKGKHLTVDDVPFGGGAGMVLKPEPLCNAVDELKQQAFKSGYEPYVIFPSPDGVLFSQERAIQLAKRKYLLFICGRYKGVDERFRQTRVDEEISIGDYVLSGGELPALTIIDAIVRLQEGVLTDFESATVDSFYQTPLLDCAWYTRPWEFEGLTPPEVLKSGNHKQIDEWRQKSREEKTKARRPDLWEKWLELQNKKEED
ncbi:MAG: tRNA (guanosine(37)-N1)-methyltransferase TrmD [bacterium]|nr:tRNA (guanosine(37)-N1)-methyltransferase TrmD [bacterium]